MDRLFLHTLNLQCIQLLIKHLHDIHGDGFMDLLPQVSSEDLNQGDLQSGDFAMHENSSQVKLDLEPNIDIGTIDSGGPPQGETTVRNLGQTGSLRIRQLFELHTLFKPRSLLPEETLPSWEISSFEKCVLEDSLHTAQGLDHISTVGIEIPQFSIMALVCPPEGVHTKNLVLLEDGPDTPTPIVGQGVPVLAEEGIDTRNTTIPRILQILERQSSILRIGLLALQCILCPHTLRVHKLTLPGLQITEKVGNQLIGIVTETRTEMRHTRICLLAVTKITLGNQHMTHRKHSKATQLLGAIENNGWETTRHLTVQANLDTGLDLVFILYEQVQELLCIQHGLSVVRHETNQGSVPFVGNLGEGRCATAHEDLTDAIVKGLDGFFLDTQMGLGGHLLGGFILQIPNTILVHCSSGRGPTHHGFAAGSKRLDAHFKSNHVKEQVGIIGTIDADKSVIPVE
mmetsp:Transcript_39127/g.70495  ORF Transcript_39127/g.70495 Transcript_39127/m.70495 type:complete len:457 (+) Transcript_39127:2263-3633(+)